MSDEIKTSMNDQKEGSMSQNVSECPTSAAAAETECPKVGHLPARQQAAIELILTGATDTAVAEALSVNRRTVHRWRVLDERFRSELDRRRREVFDTANDRLRSMLVTALDRLEKQVRDRYDPTSHRAAKTLLTLARVGQVMSYKTGSAA